MDYKVAICSYRRAGLLERKTLRVLQSGKVPMEKVTIFTPRTDSQFGEYCDLGFRKLVKVNGNVPTGLAKARLAVQQHYSIGTPVLWMDDDVSAVVGRNNERRLQVVEDIDALVRDLFSSLEVAGLKLWGVYPIPSSQFMSPKIKIGLYFCIGSMYGTFNTHDNMTPVVMDLDNKTDYECTMQHYLRDGGVMRHDYVSVRSNYYTEPGGLQVHRTKQNAERAVQGLMETYSGYFRQRKPRKTGFPEIAFKKL